MAKITFNTSGLSAALNALARETDALKDEKAADFPSRVIDALEQVHSCFEEFQNILDDCESDE